MQSHPMQDARQQAPHNSRNNYHRRPNQPAAGNVFRQSSSNPNIMTGYVRTTGTVYRRVNAARQRLPPTGYPPVLGGPEMPYSYFVQQPPQRQQPQQPVVVTPVGIGLNNAMGIQSGRLLSYPTAAAGNQGQIRFSMTPVVMNPHLATAAAARSHQAPPYQIVRQPRRQRISLNIRSVRPHAIAIIDPVTRRNILEDLPVNESIPAQNVRPESTSMTNADRSSQSSSTVMHTVATPGIVDVKEKTSENIPPLTETDASSSNCLHETLSQNLSNNQPVPQAEPLKEQPLEENILPQQSSLPMSNDNSERPQEDDCKESCTGKYITSSEELQESAVLNFEEDEKQLQLNPPNCDDQQEQLVLKETLNDAATGADIKECNENVTNSNNEDNKNKTNNTNENKILPTFAEVSIKADDKLDKPPVNNIKKAGKKTQKQAKKKKAETAHKNTSSISEQPAKIKNEDVGVDEKDNAKTSSLDGVANEQTINCAEPFPTQSNDCGKCEASKLELTENITSAGQEADEAKLPPSNTCAEKQYTREQLMQLRAAKASRVQPNLKNSSIYSEINLMPNFAFRSNANFRCVASATEDQHRNRNSAKDIIHVDLNLEQNVQLNEAENAWRPKMLNTELPDTEMDAEQKAQHEKDQLIRRVRGILNKLTPEKFDPLVDEIIGLKIDTMDKMNSVMLLVFEKAVDEPNFSLSYATLCQRLVSEIKARDEQVESGAKSNLAIFHRSLLAKAEFEFTQNVTQTTTKDVKLQPLREKISHSTDANERTELKALLEEEERKLRRRSGGTVRFIGELFKLSMLTGKIINSCLESLLKDASNEDKLECLCKLLSTVGQKFEQTPISNTDSRKFSLDSLINRMQNIVANKKNKKVSSRIRFMLLDVIDLRKMNWQSKRNETPKTLEQIEKDSNDEEINKLYQVMAATSSEKNDLHGGRNVDRHYGGRHSQSSDSSTGQQDGAGGGAGSSNRWYAKKGKDLFAPSRK